MELCDLTEEMVPVAVKGVDNSQSFESLPEVVYTIWFPEKRICECVVLRVVSNSQALELCHLFTNILFLSV